MMVLLMITIIGVILICSASFVLQAAGVHWFPRALISLVGYLALFMITFPHLGL